MSERRLYIDPDDGYQTEVLAPAINAAEPGGEDVDVIELSRPDSERARTDGVEPHETPAYVFRERGDVVERYDGYEGVRSSADDETHDQLAHEHGYLNERGELKLPGEADR